jgi:hypothetical protein
VAQVVAGSSPVGHPTSSGKSQIPISKDLALTAVDALAKDDKAKAFYLSHGFQELRDDPLHLFLSMKTIAKRFEKG